MLSVSRLENLVTSGDVLLFDEPQTTAAVETLQDDVLQLPPRDSDGLEP